MCKHTQYSQQYILLMHTFSISWAVIKRLCATRLVLNSTPYANFCRNGKNQFIILFSKESGKNQFFQSAKSLRIQTKLELYVSTNLHNNSLQVLVSLYRYLLPRMLNAWYVYISASTATLYEGLKLFTCFSLNELPQLFPRLFSACMNYPNCFYVCFQLAWIAPTVYTPVFSFHELPQLFTRLFSACMNCPNCLRVCFQLAWIAPTVYASVFSLHELPNCSHFCFQLAWIAPLFTRLFSACMNYPNCLHACFQLAAFMQCPNCLSVCFQLACPACFAGKPCIRGLPNISCGRVWKKCKLAIF
jgi:hypothetical protein